MFLHACSLKLFVATLNTNVENDSVALSDLRGRESYVLLSLP